jgi:predicted kinase
MYGNPGSGKTFFARQTAELLGIPHISSDRIRYELFEKPTFSREEQTVVQNIMLMMLEEYFKVGLSAIFDVSLNRATDRKAMREICKKQNRKTLLIWLQADHETCFARASKRDKRKNDDQYSVDMTQELYESIEKSMQPPTQEDAVVISGKHLYSSQKSVFLRKLRELGVLHEEAFINAQVPKPELVNLVSGAHMAAGRVDQNRRNVLIR